MSENERVEIDLGASARRAYDQWRSRLAKLKQPGERSDIWDLVLLIPDLVVLLGRLARDARVPRGAKLIAGLALAYVASPIDLIPEFLGPIGFLDDFLVLSLAVSRLLNYVHPDIVRSHWSGHGDVLESIQRASEWGESLLVDRLPKTLRGLLSGR